MIPATIVLAFVGITAAQTVTTTTTAPTTTTAFNINTILRNTGCNSYGCYGNAYNNCGYNGCNNNNYNQPIVVRVPNFNTNYNCNNCGYNCGSNCGYNYGNNVIRIPSFRSSYNNGFFLNNINRFNNGYSNSYNTFARADPVQGRHGRLFNPPAITPTKYVDGNPVFEFNYGK